MSVEQITVQTRSRSGASDFTYSADLKVGGQQFSAQQSQDSLSDIDVSGQDVVVRIPRTPNTQKKFVIDAVVDWRDELWRIDTRTEVLMRTAYDLSLVRTA